MPSKPCAPPESHTSRGTMPSFSHWSWNGATFFSAQPRTISRNSSCPASYREWRMVVSLTEGALRRCEDPSVTTPERTTPPMDADERATLEGWLDFYRATLVGTCDGLSDEHLRTASAPPSPLTLLGLVQHLAEVERNWFRRVLAGEQAPPIHDPDV